MSLLKWISVIISFVCFTSCDFLKHEEKDAECIIDQEIQKFTNQDLGNIA